MDDNWLSNQDNNTTVTFDLNMSGEAWGQYDCDTESSITFQFYTWGIIANIITVYGIVGNILSILVLRHRMMQSSTSLYLISLAVYDTGVLLSMCLFLALPTLYLEKGYLQNYYYAYKYMHPFCYPIALVAQTGTIYTTLAFTVERYIAVCHPLQAANTCTRSRTKRVILLIFLCCVVYNIPRFLESETTEVWNSYYNRTEPQIQQTELGTSKAYREIYFIYLQLFIMFLFPFSLLAVLNIQLIRAVKVAQLTRHQMSVGSSKTPKVPPKEPNLTIMLIAVVMVFLVCQLPSVIDNILWTIFDVNELNCSLHYIRFTTLSNLMVVINSAINFVIYCMFGKRFRRVFVKMFIPCKKNKNQYKYVMYESTMNSRVGGAQKPNGNDKMFDTESTFL
ncbi:FMRFamide receptor-like [Argopecten irradians]|uniref:FMRFamide receptor-like n=1 Tax=Argopecten irradians TaxID=31199 RepID=UPI0037130EE7